MIQPFKAKAVQGGINVTVGGKTFFFEDITEDYMSKALKRYADGAYVQNAFSKLSADQREFLMSGLLPEEFDALYNEEDDEFDYTYFS